MLLVLRYTRFINYWVLVRGISDPSIIWDHPESLSPLGRSHQEQIFDNRVYLLLKNSGHHIAAPHEPSAVVEELTRDNVKAGIPPQCTIQRPLPKYSDKTQLTKIRHKAVGSAVVKRDGRSINATVARCGTARSGGE